MDVRFLKASWMIMILTKVGDVLSVQESLGGKYFICFKFSEHFIVEMCL